MSGYLQRVLAIKSKSPQIKFKVEDLASSSRVFIFDVPQGIDNFGTIRWCRKGIDIFEEENA